MDSRKGKKQRNNNETTNSTERNVFCPTGNCVNLNSAYNISLKGLLYNILYSSFNDFSFGYNINLFPVSSFVTK